MKRCVCTGRIVTCLCLLAVVGSLAWCIYLRCPTTLPADSELRTFTGSAEVPAMVSFLTLRASPISVRCHGLRFE